MCTCVRMLMSVLACAFEFGCVVLYVCACVPLINALWINTSIMCAAGKMDEALPYCEKSLEVREKVFGSHHLHVAMSLCGLGGMCKSKPA